VRARGEYRIVGWNPFNLIVACLFQSALVSIGAVVGRADAKIVDSAASLVVGGLIGSGLLLIGSAHVAIRGDTIVVVNSLTCTAAGLEDVRSIAADHGLQVELWSGRKVGSLALGSSLLGALTGDRRAKAVASRIARLLTLPEEAATAGWHQDRAVTAPRLRAFVVALAIAALPVATAICVRRLG